jgi:hypothetical protein
MKSPRYFVIAALVAAAVSGPFARAQVFTSSTPSTADADVLNTGSTALAFDFSDAFIGTTSTTTVNGVTFSGSQTNAATNVSFAYTNLPNNDTNGTYLGANGTTTTANYIKVLSGLMYQANDTSATLTLSGLKSGDAYTLQIFSGTGGVGGPYSEIFSDNGMTGLNSYGGGVSANYFLTETFTAATSGTETLQLLPPVDSDFTILNAVNLRDESVPEPSTYALMLGGLGMLGFMLRRRLSA